MDTLQILHTASEVATFTAYSFVSYGLLALIKKYPRHRKVLTLFMVSLMATASVYISHVMFVDPDSGSVPATALVAVNAFLAILTAWVFLPLAAAAQEHSQDVGECRTRLDMEVARADYFEHNTAFMSDAYNLLCDVNRVVIASPGTEALTDGLCAALGKYPLDYCWIGEWSEHGCSLVSSYNFSGTVLCDDMTLAEFFDDQNIVSDVDARTHIVYFHIKSHGKDYTLCVAYPIASDNSKFLNVLASVASDFEFALHTNEIARRLVAVEREKLDMRSTVDYLKTHDPSTGLTNRTRMAELGENAIRKCEKSGTHLAVLFIDVDDFTRVVNTEGHTYSDTLILAVVSRINALLKKTDAISRFGTDEFVVHAAVSGIAEATGFAQKVQHAFSSPITVNNKSFKFTVSVGAAMYPSDAENYNDLVFLADRALGQAKLHGKNTVSFAEKVGLSVESLLSRDLDSSRLSLAYQPLLDLRTDTAVGLEVLVRWHSQELGQIGTTLFLQVAEYAGLITRLGGFVIDGACRQWREWVDRGMLPLSLSINVSASQLRDCSLAVLLTQALTKYRIPPSYIWLEIAETALTGGLSVIDECLDALRVMGVQIVIDDFGSGYASLPALKRFAVDALKIDHGFTARLDRDIAVVRSVLGLARDLKLRVVAEGVETTVQLQVLKDLGCPVAQGNLLCEPLPPDQVFDWINQRMLSYA